MRPSEDEIIARYLTPLAGQGSLGLRDDAALLAVPPGSQLIATKDVLVAGVHFLADDPPEAIAAKALRVNLSDLAAKAAEPLGILLGLALPDDWTEPWLAAFSSGLQADLAYFSCSLLGGDTTATPGPLTISITALGLVETGGFVPRSGARAGDLLFVSGTIGDGALGLKARLNAAEDRAWLGQLDSASTAALIARYQRPEPRLALRRALRSCARAAMDVSDGFVGDLQKMLRLEGLSAQIEAVDVPLSPAVRAAVAREPRLLTAALTGGDDYEIICAIAPGEIAAFQEAAATAGVSVTQIGIATASDARISVRDASGAPLNIARAGFQHFGTRMPSST